MNRYIFTGKTIFSLTTVACVLAAVGLIIPEVASAPSPDKSKPSTKTSNRTNPHVALQIAEMPPGLIGKEILIGTPNAQSGDNEFAGRETNIGINAYIDSINTAGGIEGRKLKVASCDDKYEVPGAYNCFNSLKDKVFAITGLVGSALLAKYVIMCTNDKLPIVGCYSGPSFVGNPVKKYVFTTRLGYREEEEQFVDLSMKNLGVKNFAIIYQNDSYGADHLQGLKDALAKHNGTMVAAASYTRNTTNIEDAYKLVKEKNPDIVSLAANHKQCTEVIKRARAEGWKTIFYINSGANVDGFIPLVGKDGNGVLVSETVPSANRADVPLIKEYQKALKQFYPKEKPCFTSLRGYIDAVVLVEGIKKTGKDLTKEKFVNALEAMKNVDIGLGPGMEITYSPTDHWGLHKYAFGVVENGDVLPIKNWKKDLR